MKRRIIKIDEDKCNGCGLCIPDCPEGALQIIDGKARLISDLFCDGLGACIKACPVNAMTIEEREAEEYNEAKVMVNIVKAGENTIKARAADAVAGRPAKDLLKGLCREQKQLIALLQAVDLIVVSQVYDVDSHHPEG